MDRDVFQEQFGLLGTSESMKQVIDKIMQVAPTDISILLQGESGVGKDVTARAIHAMSQRKRENLVIVNCGAIPEGIIESELFGHEKGAFTGASDSREGYFEKANNGTIFLDEIGDTPLNIQVKLLRVLENGEYFRVGSSKVQTTDVRVIAATNKDLWELVQEGKFREDLYYRLDTVKIHIPPLRERSEDIIALFRKFVQEFSSKYDSVFRGFSDDAKLLLTSYRWPGNVRELRNVAEQLVVLEKSQFVDVDKLQKYLKGRQHTGSTDNLPIVAGPENQQDEFDEPNRRDRELIYRALVELRSDIADVKKMVGNLFYAAVNDSGVKALPQTASPSSNPIIEEIRNIPGDYPIGVQSLPVIANEVEEQDEDEMALKKFLSTDEIPSIEDTERFLIEHALKKFNGNRRKASDTLGISERTLYRKLDQYGIE